MPLRIYKRGAEVFEVVRAELEVVFVILGERPLLEID